MARSQKFYPGDVAVVTEGSDYYGLIAIVTVADEAGAMVIIDEKITLEMGHTGVFDRRETCDITKVFLNCGLEYIGEG